MTIQKATNITWHHAQITKADREKLLKQKGVVIWYTGLSASGKSTIAHAVEQKLYEREVLTYVLDGDNIRHGLNGDLGFSPEDRDENIRRIGEVAHLFAQSGMITITSFISPYKKGRDRARQLNEDGEFLEVFVKAPLDVCEERDPKGLYKKARAGIIKEFTGISDPYEEPQNAETVIDTSDLSPDEAAQTVLLHLEHEGYIAGDS